MKNNNLKIAIFIDRDVTIRHFLDSNIFKGLNENHTVNLIFPPQIKFILLVIAIWLH